MTTMQLHLDIIQFRKGQIDLDELRRRFPSWRVSRDYARFCVERAIEAGRVMAPTPREAGE